MTTPGPDRLKARLNSKPTRYKPPAGTSLNLHDLRAIIAAVEDNAGAAFDVDDEQLAETAAYAAMLVTAVTNACYVVARARRERGVK